MDSRKIVLKKLGPVTTYITPCPHCKQEIEREDRREDTAGLIVFAMSQPRNGQNVDMTEIMEEVPIIKKFKEIKFPDIGQGEIFLSEEEYKLVLNKMEKAHWASVNESIAEVITAVQEAEIVPMAPVSKKQAAS